MCRIYGHLGGNLAHHHLRAVSALQRHGGPDARFSAAGDDWALGNNRLAIIDLDGGEQPFKLGRDIQVVFNGELYNHKELRQRLHALGYVFHDHCDGNVLPALYHHYGLDFVEHLDGMYAVAIIDLRAEPKLVLATDEAGMKPLYYHWDRRHRQLYFSSELPALLSVPGPSWEESIGGLDAYLTTKTPFGEQTMFDQVQVLPRAATAVYTRDGGLKIDRRAKRDFPVVPTDLETAGQRAQYTLRTETHRLALADVPISTITSGGLDSSLVTALLAEKVPHVHAFNIAYTGDWPFDEKRYAREVARLSGARYHQIEADPAEFPKLMDEVVWHLGQPNADPITLSTYLLFQGVSEAGFKVTLSGDAADEIFGGYGRIKKALTDGDGWDRNYVDALAAIPSATRNALYTEDYRDYLRDNGSEFDRIVGQLRAGSSDRLAAITEFEVDQRLPAYHLRRVDHLSMAHSVEVRLPFCQTSVTDLARSLPTDLRVRGDEVKRTLYAAARGLVPDSVLNRPKQPFTLPITAMLADGQPLLGYARDMLASGHDGRLDPQAVEGLIKTQAANPNDESALAIWSLLIHRIWTRQITCQGERRAA
ncbi:asparagine synthase (glutamine-hydrolysing) [Amycolatopsis xylanica]|uniref:asparagine synthase (glutamine-hydrolyzing) n=1 Tax=Amycolatopsis xylanica TaxID=589385 RepID=A0A1H2UW49_9PSEU|nr:asparagine synthase (glutamine-hydrolyzing) [Amycolatopsis xylanica]SDW60302.1 asparagine synthase (glutamine-hydrolysing) [Amycolatopsis xylanica]